MKKISVLLAFVALMFAWTGNVKAQCTDADCYIIMNVSDGYGYAWYYGDFAITVYQNGEELHYCSMDYNEYDRSDTIRVCTANGPIEFDFEGYDGYYGFNANIEILDSLGTELLTATSMSELLGMTSNTYTYKTKTLYMSACPDCLPVKGLVATNLMANSADISFTEIGTATSWEYTYGTSPVCDSNWQYTSSNPISLTDLKSHTKYYAFVRSNCGSSYSDVKTLEFLTPCDDVNAFPYTEDFETGDLSLCCWQVVESYTDWSTYPYLVESYWASNGQVYPHSGNWQLYFYTYYADLSVASPLVTSSDPIRVQFWAAGKNDVQVGYFTDITDASTFTLVQSVPVTSGETYKKYAVDFPEISGDYYVGIRVPKLTLSTDFFIDDIVIKKQSTCPEPSDFELVQSEIDASSITLTWKDTLGTQWEIAYGATGFSLDAEHRSALATSTTATITGLAIDTLYDFHIRTKCLGEDGEWLEEVVSARPGSYNMTKLLDSITACGAVIYDEGGPNGQYGYANSNRTRILTINPTTEQEAVKLSGTYSFYSYNYNYDQEHCRLAIFEGPDTTGRLLASYYSYNTYSGTVNVASESGPITIAFRVPQYSGYSGDGYELIAQCYDKPDCLSPYDFRLTGSDGENARFAWKCNAVPEKYTLTIYDEEDNIILTKDIDGTALADTVNTGLDEKTNYYATLTSSCENSDGALIARTEFQTPCVVGGDKFVGVLPYYSTDYSGVTGDPYYGWSIGQTFVPTESLGDMTAINGITYYVGSGSGTFDMDIFFSFTDEVSDLNSGIFEPDSLNDRVYSGTISFSKGAVTIEFDSAVTVVPGKNLVITHWNHTGSNAGYVYFECWGYQSNPYYCRYAYDWSNYYCDPWNYAYSYSSGYVPNLTLLSPCGDKSCQGVKNLNVVPGDGSITLSWDKGYEEAAWRVEYKHQDSSSFTVFASSLAVQNCTITGLEGGYKYTVRVISLCDEEKTMSRTVEVRPNCTPADVPVVWDMSNYYLPSTYTSDIQPCWYRVCDASSTYTGYPYYDSYYNYIYFYVDYYNGSSPRGTLVSPIISKPANELSVFFSAHSYEGTYYQDMVVEVGVCSDPEDPTTYEVVETVPVGHHENIQYYAATLENYEGTGNRIFVRVDVDPETATGTSSDYGYVFMDTLSIDVIPECIWLMGNSVIAGASQTSITVNIDDKYGHDEYNVYYNTSDNFNTASKITVSSTTATITGLTSNTLYYVWVAGKCGESISNVVDLGDVRTACDAIPVTKEKEYFTDFEDESSIECYRNQTIVGQGTAAWMWLPDVSYPNGGSAYSGTGAMFFTTGYNYNMEARLVLPIFDFSGLDTIGELSFWRYQQSYPYSGSYKPQRLQIFYRTSADADWTFITTVDSTEDEYMQHYVKLPNSMGAPFYQISMVASNYNAFYNGENIDDLRVGAATLCTPPTVELTDITERSVTVNWSECNYNEVRISYKNENDFNWSARSSEGVNGEGSIIIAPLSMNTTYKLHVEAECAPGEYSAPSSNFTFKTIFCSNSNDVVNYSSTEKDTTIVDQLFGTDYYGSAEYPSDGCYTYSEVLVPASKLSSDILTIDKISFFADKSNMGEYLTGVTIYMANTTESTLTNFLYDDSFKMVYSGDATYTTAGKVELPLTNSFEWDGTSNIVIGFYHNPKNWGYEYDNNYFAAHVASDNKFAWVAANNTIDPSSASSLPASYKNFSNVVPDIELGACVPVCYAPIVKSTTTTATSATVNWYNEKNMVVEVSIRPEGATSWENPTTVSGATKFTVTGLMPMTKYQFRLRRDCANSGIGFSDETTVDVLTDTACSVPENVKAIDVTATTATLSWTNTAVANKWIVHVWNDGFNKRYTVTTNPATIDGLTPGNSYKVQVRAYCGSNDHVIGDWSETTTFQNTCEPVTGLTATVQGTSVKLSWSASSNSKKYYVVWGDANFNPNDQIGYAEVDGTSYTVTGLKGKTYTFRVLAACEDGWYSVWATTNATVVGIDDVEQNAQFTLQPNPATDHVTLSLNDFEGTANVSILSVDGRQVNSFSTVEGNYTLDLSDYAAGTYFVRVQTDGWVSVRKLVVK